MQLIFMAVNGQDSVREKKKYQNAQKLSTFKFHCNASTRLLHTGGHSSDNLSHHCNFGVIYSFHFSLSKQSVFMY